MSLYLVGEAYGEQEEAAGKPFVGPSGQVLNHLLKDVGLSRRDVIVDNVFNLRPAGNEIERFFTKEEKLADTSFGPLKAKLWVHRDFAHHVYALRERILAAHPNVVVALGSTPLWALTGLQGITKFRGAPTLCSFAPIKLIATWHPAAIMRQWELRPVAYMDLSKAVRHSADPQFKRPERQILIAPTLVEIERFYYDFAKPARYLAADTETKQLTITEIGFAADESRAIVIPFYSRANVNYWPTAQEEKAAWLWVRKYLELPNVWQNGSYDLKYLWQTVGLPAPNFRGDSMLLHHSLEPELKKGLEFLGSIYTDEPPWKMMRKESDSVAKKGD